MKKVLFIIPVLALALSSCVSKKNYESLQTQYSQLQNDYNTAQVRIAEYTSDSKSLAARLADEQKRNEELRRAYAKLQEAYNQLQGDYTNNVSQGNVNISKLVDESTPLTSLSNNW